MKQDAINSAFVAITKLTEQVAADVMARAEKLEDAPGPACWHEAQKNKMAANILNAAATANRKSYPHLFGDNQ